MPEDFLTYQIDTSQWDTLMHELNYRQLKSAWRSGLRPSAQTIEKGVISELQAKHPAAYKYRAEVRIKMWPKGGGYTVGLSQGQLTMDFSKSGKLMEMSHLYILRWLSRGTAERYTKRGARRGRITASRFFPEGVEKNLQPAVFRIGDDITKALQRAFARARAAKPAAK